MLAKPFLKRELYDMVNSSSRPFSFVDTSHSLIWFSQILIQSDMNVFFQTVPKECIPSDLGGTLPTRKELQGKRELAR